MKENSIRNKIRKEGGITLVALIITIIVLLILAIVSIRLIMNGGIIDRAERGTQAYSEAEIQEQIKLAYSEWQTAQWTSEAGDAATFVQTRLRTALNDNGLTVTAENGVLTVELANGKTYTYNVTTGVASKVKTIAEYPDATPGTATTENSKYTSDGKTAVIPAGYTVSSNANEQSIDNGLVVKNGDNEWVWIPVSSTDLAAMYTEDSTGWTMYGTGGETGIDAVVTKYKTTGTQTRVNPGDTSSSREPDTIVGELPSYSGGGGTDNIEANYTAAGFSSFSNMATALKDDYKNMIDSVKKYGGFYVGRYELGGTTSAPQEKAGTVMNNTDWYNLYKACKIFGDESTTYSRMIWDCQWDQVCKFISTYKEGNETKNRDLTNSCSYGNYINSTGDAAKNSGSSNFNNKTGRNEAWKTNNIYDLAGNCNEWTQEATGTYCRAFRGGYYSYRGDLNPVTKHNYTPPTYANSIYSSRPVLYLK